MSGVNTRLRMAREQAGLSQAQVARVLGMHRPTVSEIEAGRRRVSAEEVSSFANLYGVSVAWIVGTEEKSDELEDRVQLAARELAKLKKDDLERVLKLLATMRDSPG